MIDERITVPSLVNRSTPGLRMFIDIAATGNSPTDPTDKGNIRRTLEDIPIIKWYQDRVRLMEGYSTHLLNNRQEQRDNALKFMEEVGSYSGVDPVTHKDEYAGKVRRDRQAHIILGLPGCGKSSSLANPLSEAFNAKLIDSDMIKETLPEYREGMGTNEVHKESGDLAKTAMGVCMDKGENMIIPKVGDEPDKVIELMEKLKAKDYQICVHYIELDQYKALSRNLSRFIEGGRYISLDFSLDGISDDGCDLIGESFEKIKDSGLCDAWTYMNNDVKKGEPPILIDYDIYEPDGDLDLVHRETYDKYMDKLQAFIDSPSLDKDVSKLDEKRRPDNKVNGIDLDEAKNLLVDLIIEDQKNDVEADKRFLEQRSREIEEKADMRMRERTEKVAGKLHSSGSYSPVGISSDGARSDAPNGEDTGTKKDMPQTRALRKTRRDMEKRLESSSPVSKKGKGIGD